MWFKLGDFVFKKTNILYEMIDLNGEKILVVFQWVLNAKRSIFTFWLDIFHHFITITAAIHKTSYYNQMIFIKLGLIYLNKSNIEDLPAFSIRHSIQNSDCKKNLNMTPRRNVI